jgi:hypothetical protein
LRRNPEKLEWLGNSVRIARKNGAFVTANASGIDGFIAVPRNNGAISFALHPLPFFVVVCCGWEY